MTELEAYPYIEIRQMSFSKQICDISRVSFAAVKGLHIMLSYQYGRPEYIVELQEKSWVEATARVDKKFVEAYGGEGPYLVAETVEGAQPPKTEIIDFSNPNE